MVRGWVRVEKQAVKGNDPHRIELVRNSTIPEFFCI
jgi:hypothetical protein